MIVHYCAGIYKDQKKRENSPAILKGIEVHAAIGRMTILGKS